MRQPALAGVYVLEARGRSSKDPRVLNELACLQAEKGAFGAAQEKIALAERGGGAGSWEMKLTLAVNSVTISLKRGLQLQEFEALAELASKLEPFIESCKEKLSSLAGDPAQLAAEPETLFNWHSALPSPPFQCLNLMSALKEWLMERDEAVRLLQCLLECRNEHRNGQGEAHLLERLNRLLGVQGVQGVQVGEIPRTPLISKSFNNV